MPLIVSVLAPRQSLVVLIIGIQVVWIILLSRQFIVLQHHPDLTLGQISMAEVKYKTVHGPIVGECTENSVIIWYRDELGLQQPPTITYWRSNDPSDTTAVSVSINPDADYTSQTKIENLTPNTLYFYKVGNSEGSFTTPGSPSCSFIFGSCIGGQGYGRNAPDSPDGEGFPIFEKIFSLKPDFFLLNGDSIYADDAIEQESTSPWNKGNKYIIQNGLSTMPAAKELNGFRGRYKYHLEDVTYAKVLRNCPVYANWDDHEILDNFGQQLLREKGLGNLFDEGRQAFLEYWPRIAPPDDPSRMYKKFEWGPHLEVFILDSRSYRDVHEQRGADDTPFMQYILGHDQLQWLLSSLSQSKSTWKMIATSIPLSYPTGWPTPDVDGYDGWSDGKRGHVGGPEAELKQIFDHLRVEKIANIVFLSGDVHFPFAISYDPFHSGKPLFYEIGATPFHALCLPPPENGPDDTFNPTVLFAQGSFGGKDFNFGQVSIADDGEFSFHIRDRHGSSIYNLELTPDGVTNEKISLDNGIEYASITTPMKCKATGTHAGESKSTNSCPSFVPKPAA